MKQGVERVHALDILRGFAILAMIFHHALYDVESMYGITVPFLHTGLFFGLQFIFVCLFILISGSTTRVSRSNIRRGLIVLALAMGLTAVTLIFMPENAIYFGILHFMGSAMLVYGLLEKWLRRLPRVPLATVSLVLFFITWYFIEYKPVVVPVPHLYMFGLRDANFFSADYYPFFPWFFMFVVGSCLSGPIFERRLPGWFYRLRAPLLETVGRNTLPIYLLHQPVVLGILWIIFKLVG